VPEEAASKPRDVPRPRSLRAAPTKTKLVHATVHTACAIVLVISLFSITFEVNALVRGCLLLGLYIVFEETSIRESTLRIKLSSGPAADMTSVWTLAAAVILPLAYCMTLIALLLTHQLIRHQRTKLPYVAAYAISVNLLSGGAAHLVVVATNGHTGGLSPTLVRALVVCAAILAFTTVNRLTVYISYASWDGLNGQGLVGDWDDNLLEISTLCLGGLASVAVVYEPWITPLVLLPMILLQRGALIRELETVASTDSKTGLLNAIAWEQLAQRELSRSSRESQSVAILIIDLDRFKAVNDVYGHLVGDVVLREIGRCLVTELRDYDVVGRFGGEEFVALLPDAGTAQAAVIAERIRARINTLQMSALSPDTVVSQDSILSASIGVACSPQDGNELQELLHAADTALYVAKNAGRNRVEFAKAAS
jgi:diguanylate cyclase (GGDEF)-like protein